MAENDNIILGIHSYIAGDKKGSDAVIDGHAWISATRNGVTTTYGTWPDDHPLIQGLGLDNGKGSDIRTNIEGSPGYPKPTASHYVELTPEQTKKFEAELKENVTWGTFNNCSSWASHTYSQVTGEKLSARELLIADTPRQLAESIRHKEQEHTTSLEHPAPPVKSKSSSLSENSHELPTRSQELLANAKDKVHELYSHHKLDYDKQHGDRFTLAAAGLAADNNMTRIDMIGVSDRGLPTSTLTICQKDGFKLQTACMPTAEASKVTQDQAFQSLTAFAQRQEQLAPQQQALQQEQPQHKARSMA